MPNHVSNKITFSCGNDLAEKIISEISHGEKAVDFNTLIPQPLSVYQGNLCKEDDDDFEDNTWYKWNRANWNTKWNAYNCEAKNDNGAVEIYFETAWDIPYPFVIAFANKYGLTFTHKYFDEGMNFWGVETWEEGRRTNRNRDPEDIKKELHIELCGWDYEADEDKCA